MFELLLAMAIMAFISTLIIVQIQVRDIDHVKLATERLASHLRQIRNLTTARIANAGGSYPAGGYGIFFDGSTGSYVLFGDDDNDNSYNVLSDSLVEEVIINPDSEVSIRSYINPSDVTFSIIFKNEHEVFTDMVNGSYSVEVFVPSASKKGVIDIYDLSADGYTWGNIQVNYEDN